MEGYRLFHSLSSIIEESEYKGEKFHAYYCHSDYEPTKIRVDYNREFSFEITKHEDEEVYNSDTNEWEVIEKEWYHFYPLDDYPLTIDEALNCLK